MVSPDPRGQNPCSELGPCREDVRGYTLLEVLLWKQNAGSGRQRSWKEQEQLGSPQSKALVASSSELGNWKCRGGTGPGKKTRAFSFHP